MMAKPLAQMPYQTLGDLTLTFPATAVVENYRRDLDLATATARVSYATVGVTFEREVFASAPDDRIVVRLSANRPGSTGKGLCRGRRPGARGAVLPVRTGVEIDLSWKGGAVERATVRSLLGRPLRLRRGEILRTVERTSRDTVLVFDGDGLQPSSR